MDQAQKRENTRNTQKLRLTNIPDHVIVETMQTIIDAARREFIAKILSDLGKTIFGIGLASYFFEKFPFALRISFSVLWICLIIFSIFIHPPKGGK